MRDLRKLLGILIMVLAVALVFCVSFGGSCGGSKSSGDDDSSSDDDIFDDDSADDDSSDDDAADDDNCDPAVSTPTLDYDAICHNNGSSIDQCEDGTVTTKDFATIAAADGWGIFVQYTDNGCDLGFYVHADGTADPVLAGTECGTGSQSGVFFSWDYVAACDGHAGETINLADSIQMKDTCNFLSAVWAFQLNVTCN